MNARSVVTEARQLDLFADALSPDQQRRCDALVCLRDSVCTALEVVAYLRHGGAVDTHGTCESGSWAYCVCRAGVRFETHHAWWTLAHERGEPSGFQRTPAQLVTWAELTELMGPDARRAEVASWADSVPFPRWCQLQRPVEFQPDAGEWDVSHVRREHEDPNWSTRRRAWSLVLEILDDAIERVMTSEMSE